MANINRHDKHYFGTLVIMINRPVTAIFYATETCYILRTMRHNKKSLESVLNEYYKDVLIVSKTQYEIFEWANASVKRRPLSCLPEFSLVDTLFSSKR